jgi:hypothetical protein
VNAPEITEEWLSKCGFKWEQLPRQPSKHWLLWIGGAVHRTDGFNDGHDSLGIELAKVTPPVSGMRDCFYYCWIRNDIAGRYGRLIHVRYLFLQAEVETLIEGLIGYKLHWSNVWYGSLRTPRDADRLKADAERLDKVINEQWMQRADAENGVSDIDKHKRGYVG